MPPEDKLPRASTTPVVNEAAAFVTVAIAAPSAAVTASATVTGVSAVPRTTFEAGVTSAAVTSAILPEIATLLATVAVPDVARPTAFKSDADDRRCLRVRDANCEGGVSVHIFPQGREIRREPADSGSQAGIGAHRSLECAHLSRREHVS